MKNKLELVFNEVSIPNLKPKCNLRLSHNLFYMIDPEFSYGQRWPYNGLSVLRMVSLAMHVGAPHICALLIGKLIILSQSDIYSSLIILLMRSNVLIMPVHYQ